MIDVKEAVSQAMHAFRNVAGLPRSEQAMLEEVEMVRDNGTACWAVTISEPIRRTPTPSLAQMAASLGAGDRDYKVIKIDAESGAFISMKIRKI